MLNTLKIVIQKIAWSMSHNKILIFDNFLKIFLGFPSIFFSIFLNFFRGTFYHICPARYINLDCITFYLYYINIVNKGIAQPTIEFFHFIFIFSISSVSKYREYIL